MLGRTEEWRLVAALRRVEQSAVNRRQGGAGVGREVPRPDAGPIRGPGRREPRRRDRGIREYLYVAPELDQVELRYGRLGWAATRPAGVAQHRRRHRLLARPRRCPPNA